jgi:LAO/AO transport system kinase
VASADSLAGRIVDGDRRALARAITLVESTRTDHRAEAAELLDELMPESGGAMRVGIAGTPGVGKSTLIEKLGLRLIAAGHRLAVLAIDPSSATRGGSILGDKTRMPELARAERSFIRPSPAGRTLGGVAQRTGDVLQLCEAAGYDIVLVETVGIGQSETAVAGLTDLFALLVAPAGGDDLQGIKRGVMELADVVVVNKADGDLVPAAQNTVADYAHALSFLRPKPGCPPTEVLTCSALAGVGIDEMWETIADRWTALSESERLAQVRSDQAVERLERATAGILLERLHESSHLGDTALLAEVAALRRSPTAAALDLVRSVS